MLKIKDLRTSFFTSQGEVKAVRGVSFSVKEGEIVGLVGESGSGKSVSCMSILRLLPENAKITGGEISFEGRDLTKLSGRELRKIRGGKIAMIFQDPMSSLNPLIRVGTQVEEMIRVHQPEKSREERRRETLELFRRVRIPEAEKRCRSFPYEFSGGMRQRIMIAMALANRPALLIADEPTGNLDPETSWDIMDIFKRINAAGTTIVMATHDKNIVDTMQRRVIAIEGGHIVRDELRGGYGYED